MVRDSDPSHPSSPARALGRRDPRDAGRITRCLLAWRAGDDDALHEVAPLIYEELRRLARSALRDERDRPLQPTELVHEAYLRLVDAEVDWHGRGHFFVVAARQMRRILVDLARRRSAQKREGAQRAVTLIESEVDGAASAGTSVGTSVDTTVDVMALDEALRDLARVDERKARVVELSYFAGLTIPEIARGLELSTATVERDLRTARAWLAKTLRPRAADDR